MTAKDIMKVLVADDDEPLAELIVEYFEQEFNYIDGIVSTTVEEGFEVFNNEDIDGVVSDYDFRGDQLDGLDFLEKVRQVDSDFPFILFTGKGGEEIAERAISNDVTAYVRKQSGVSQYGVLANTVSQSVQGYRAKIQNKRRLAALEAADEGIAIVDESGKLEYANNSFLDLYEYEKGDLLGMEWSHLHPDEEIERFYEEILPSLKNEGDWRGETVGLRCDGTRFNEAKSVSAMENGGLVIVSVDLDGLDTILDHKQRNN
jgi:PAS domain S-box-containing protein